LSGATALAAGDHHTIAIKGEITPGAWVSVFSTTHWDTTWLPGFASTSFTLGDGVNSKSSSLLLSATKLRMTYTVNGSSTPQLNNDSPPSFWVLFPQRPAGTWTDEVNIPAGGIPAGAQLTPDVSDAGMTAVTISNLEVFVV